MVYVLLLIFILGIGFDRLVKGRWGFGFCIFRVL